MNDNNLSGSQKFLEEVFNQKKEKNPSYSLRSFARDLDIPSGRVSQYLSGKRNITLDVGKKIIQKLDLSKNDEIEFLEMIAFEKEKRSKYVDGLNIGSESQFEDYSHVSNNIFRVISDWYYYAILSLIKTVDFQNSSEWIARRLGIEATVAADALRTLEEVGLITKEDGKITRVEKLLKTSSDVESKALKISHTQSLDQAKECLYNVPVELRDVSSITMPINTRNIKKAKEMIKKFRRNLSKVLCEGDTDEVYNLNIQLVPVTKVDSEV